MRASVTEETVKLLTSYAYDKVGNRIQKVENGAITTYRYNSLNQLETESGAYTLTYAYNGNGQQISVSGSGVIKTYAYTPADMLASYTSGSDTQTNLYNGDDERNNSLKRRIFDTKVYVYAEETRKLAYLQTRYTAA